MRVTNRMMTTNMLNNIYRNKNNVDTLGYQYSTQNKIEKPSDDPVVAVRSLKFRTQITELEQYLGKNIPDANNWMDTTEKAMVSMNEILRYMNTYCNQGANDTLETYDRNSIIETLEQYKEGVFQEANADYAGRYLFTGFRTDIPLLFDKESLKQQKAGNTLYTVQEELSFMDITQRTFVKNGASYAAGTSADAYAQAAASTGTANRLQLSYTDLDAGPETTVSGITRKTGIQSITFTDPADNTQTITLPDPDPLAPSGYTLKTVSNTTIPQGSCYSPGDKEIFFIPETGELIFGTEAYTMAQDKTDFSITYTKSRFEEGDIIPQHYFESSASSILPDGGGFKEEVIQYTNPSVQKIEYEINFSQKLTVNTLAKDSVSTTIRTKIDEIIRSVNEVFDMNDRIAEVDKLIAIEADETEMKNLNELKSQLETEQTLKKSILRKAFASGITVSQKAQDALNVALANHGSRALRLELTQSRLESQSTSFTKLLSENDKVDLEDSIINYKQAQMVYDASLSCASTILSKTLLSYL